MNKFEFNQSVKKSSLSSSEKLILLEILSFIENDKVFYATNKHLASIFNFSESYVKKIISKFQNLGIIVSSVDKKKHQSGDKTWYNKRYITINFEALSSFLQMDGSIESVKPIINDLEPSIKAIESISVPIEIMSEIEDNEADKFEYNDESYSDIEFKLGNGKIVYVQAKYAKTWFEIENRPRYITNLRSNSSQYMFDREVKDKLDEVKRHNEFYAKYQ